MKSVYSGPPPCSKFLPTSPFHPSPDPLPTPPLRQEALFQSGPGSDLEYCIVRPGGLTLDAPTGVVNVIEGEAGSIARADVATFCLGAVLDKDFPYLKKAPCISSVGGTSWVKDRGNKGMMEA